MKEIEFRLYYDENGKVITYSTENIPNKNYIVITKEQFAEARSDVLVKNNKFVYTHLKKHVEKLVRGSAGTKTSKYDVNIITTNDTDYVFWTEAINDLTE
jgi:hypothetical protein